MNKILKKYNNQLEPYKGIIYFLILLFFFHFSWKIAIDGDMDSEYIYLFDKNITPDWFKGLTQFTTEAVYWFVRLFPNTDDFNINSNHTQLFFTDGGIIINIIWGCTGLKQLYIFVCLMIFYRGPFKHKLWYIPMGGLILGIYNIIRISGICWLTFGHRERFDSLHDGIFRYIYYGLIFLLWVIWEETFVKKNKPEKINA